MGAQPIQLYWQYLMDGQNSIPDLNPSKSKVSNGYSCMAASSFAGNQSTWAHDCSEHSLKVFRFWQFGDRLGSNKPIQEALL